MCSKNPLSFALPSLSPAPILMLSNSYLPHFVDARRDRILRTLSDHIMADMAAAEQFQTLLDHFLSPQSESPYETDESSDCPIKVVIIGIVTKLM